MKRLFIAEKPELAEAICAGLGNKTGSKSDGYYTCGNDIVTWCYGHMLRLSDPEEYDQKYSTYILAYLQDNEVIGITAIAPGMSYAGEVSYGTPASTLASNGWKAKDIIFPSVKTVLH